MRSAVVIMRGLPGSGKSTFVDALKQCARASTATEEEVEVEVCSADHFFAQGGGKSRAELKAMRAAQKSKKKA